MYAPLDHHRPDAAHLRGCLNDLVSVMALPALWAGSDVAHIVSSLADALLEMLHLTFVFVRLPDVDGRELEISRSAVGLEEAASAQMLGCTLAGALGQAAATWPPHAQVIVAGTSLSIASARLGLRGELGVVVAGAQRTSFPEQTERLLLDVAANQAAIALQQARLLDQQRRVSIELDRRVAERTSELARANEVLAQRERESRLVLDSIPGLIAALGAHGSVELVNRQLVDYCGRTIDELKQWETNGILHEEDLPRVRDTFARSIAAGVPFEFELRLRRFDGAYQWFNNRGIPVRGPAGETVRWYVLLTDVDERTRAETELRRSEMLLSEGLRLSATGTFSWLLDTDVLLFSEELRRIFEFDRETVSFERIAERVHADDLGLLARKMEEVRSGIDNEEYEIRLRMPDQRIKYLRVFGRLIRRQDGRLECVGAVQDVTRRRLTEEALDQARSELAHVARFTSLNALTASIAHEVNQPLAGIMTNANTCLRMLDGNPDIDGARETATRTIRDARRATDVIARLRALFSNKEFTLEPLDLNEAAREVLALSARDLQRQGVVLHSELADDLPRVTGDRVQLQQVILNLLRNAADAMAAVVDRPRDLLVRTDRHHDGAVRVSVRDAGVGIDPDHAEKLFDAFYTTKSGGMGIGLFVSRSIVERHHGRLWAERNTGPGATFSFAVPCGAPDGTD